MVNFVKDIKLVGSEENNNEIKEKVLDPIIQLYKLDNSVAGTWELLDAHLILDPQYPVLNVFNREFKYDYLDKEKEWYKSQSLSIEPCMSGIKIWNFCASKDNFKEINSNYGYLVFSSENGSQFQYCLNRLISDKDTREAMIIYTRPSIQAECSERGKHDFICTNYSHFFIRNNTLEMIHSQRSCDVVTGLSFDFPWSCSVMQTLYDELLETYPDLKLGKIHYNIDTLHVYRRSEKVLQNYINRPMIEA